jgi:hypothetical protein
VKECEALTKYLSFVISLDPQSLPGMERPETDFEFVQNVFVHQIAPLNGLQLAITYSHVAKVNPTGANSHASTDVALGHLTRALQQTASPFDRVAAQ